jgi:NAD-dependent SIR2 family protein deacetylase
LSTSSGIPDYRDDAGQWKHHKPIDHGEFLRSDALRKRYWARSFVGWPTIANARPSTAHRALAHLEQAGQITLIITQNVDGLHQKAGSQSVLELHGGLESVICLSCRRTFARTTVQDWIHRDNPDFAAAPTQLAPDGDAQFTQDHEAYGGFRIPVCPDCGQTLKPDVVFFGDSVPGERVRRGMDAICAARTLLIVGTSLMVYSGFRFASYAHRCGKNLAAINRGVTRADALFDLKIQKPCDAVLGEFLHASAAAMG